MCIIKRNLQLELIEKNLDWDSSIDFCFKNWERNRDDSDNRIRLFSQCWYMMSYWEQIPHKQDGKVISWFDSKISCNYKKISSILEQLQNQEKNTTIPDEKYNCISGYLMYIQPEYFLIKEYSHYDECKAEGMRRVKEESHSKDAECRLMADIVLHHLCIPLKKLEILFPGQSLVDQYFCHILADWH